MKLLFDEFEIVCWINFIDRFNFFDFCYNVNDAEEVLNSTYTTMMYIGVATKWITNDDPNLKAQISFELKRMYGNEFTDCHNKFCTTYGHMFNEQNDSLLRNHLIMKKLNKGFEREFDSSLDLPDL